MKINKTAVLGIIFILLSGVIFATDILNPIIRPITYLFLMGSSKGKDIMFFGLFGVFLILSQLIKKDINSQKFLKLSVIIGSVLLICGILLEILFRLELGIGLNTIFASMTNNMSSTSILHTHLLKSIFGEFITAIIGPFIQSNINTGVGLYSYVPDIGKIIIILFPILFITLVLANNKRSWIITILLGFFSSCLLIGALDGGLFGTPAIVGICGSYLVYRNEYYLNQAFGIIFHDKELFENKNTCEPTYRNKNQHILLFLLNRLLPYIIVCLIILLRFTIAFAGAESDYYTVDIKNPEDNIEINDIDIENITTAENTTTLIINNNYNEMKLLNDLKIPLKDKCEYYTLTWNIYSYM